jgi:hypothetical protein
VEDRAFHSDAKPGPATKIAPRTRVRTGFAGGRSVINDQRRDAPPRMSPGGRFDWTAFRRNLGALSASPPQPRRSTSLRWSAQVLKTEPGGLPQGLSRGSSKADHRRWNSEVRLRARRAYATISSSTGRRGRHWPSSSDPLPPAKGTNAGRPARSIFSGGLSESSPGCRRYRREARSTSSPNRPRLPPDKSDFVGAPPGVGSQAGAKSGSDVVHPKVRHFGARLG